MKKLETRQDIAIAINGHKMPVVRIDLADTDEYGIKSQKVLIDNGTFKDGFPYYISAEIRAYMDEKKFTFTQYGDCLKSDFGYNDYEKMLEERNAPIIKKDSDVVLAFVDSITKEMYAPIVLHTTNRISPYCSTPLRFIEEDSDATVYCAMGIMARSRK